MPEFFWMPGQWHFVFKHVAADHGVTMEFPIYWVRTFLRECGSKCRASRFARGTAWTPDGQDSHLRHVHLNITYFHMKFGIADHRVFNIDEIARRLVNIADNGWAHVPSRDAWIKFIGADKSCVTFILVCCKRPLV